MAGSLFDLWIERTVEDSVRSYFQSPAFKAQISKHVKWVFQGFERGFDIKHRAAFTATVSARIRDRARVLAAFDGGEVHEQRLHARFAEHRLLNEWFARHPDILAEIARLNSPSPIASQETAQ